MSRIGEHATAWFSLAVFGGIAVFVIVALIRAIF